MSLQILKITSTTLIDLCFHLSKRERQVFCYLFLNRNYRTKQNWTYYKSRKEIAEATELKDTDVRNALVSLQKDGWLSKPETKDVADDSLVGKRVKLYRWRMPKHESEFSSAKRYIEETKHKPYEPEPERIVNGHVSEITEEGKAEIVKVFNS